MIKRIFVFGNINLENDSLPLRILPRLRKRFPDINFEIRDPNEEWEVPDEFIIIDTIIGIKKIRIFETLEKFLSAPRVSMHDFDALTNLRYLFKLGKIKKIKIIGIPPDMAEPDALEEVIEILNHI
jgi:Ni,Fe-hydrogenase maturation factor